MYKILLFFILGLVLTSCSKDQTLELKENEIVSGSYVIRERSNGDWIPYTYTSKIASKSVKLSSLSHADYLGYSVRFNEYPIEDTRNIGYRVVNTESFNDDYSTYFTSLKNIGSESSYFAYSVFDDYETKSNITKKVNGGLNIKLLFFSLGVKNEYTKTFSSDIISNSNSAYGELNVIVRDSIFRMQYSSLIKSKIVNGYLDETFLEELHLTHPYEFYNNYGPFVVRDFTTGGRASVIYAGVHNSSSDTEVKSTDMSGEIESSFSFKNGNSYSGSGSLSLGRGNNTSSSYTSKFNSSKLSVKTIGGISSYGSFSVPQDVESTNIDLSGWLSSFSDSSVQSLCEYNENGLIPITDFILEKNTIDLINRYMNGYIPQKVDIIEPYILIDTASWDSVFSVIVASIINRYGDAIRVDINTFNDYDDDVIDQLFKWAGEIGDNLNMKVVYHSSIYDSDHDKLTRSYNLSRIARNINLAKKIEYNNMVYIVDEDALEGFSIPNIPQYIEEYGWTDIIKNMQYSDLTYKDLWDNNFEIYAL